MTVFVMICVSHVSCRRKVCTVLWYVRMLFGAKFQAAILKGMQDVAKERDRVEQEMAENAQRAKKWDEQIR